MKVGRAGRGMHFGNAAVRRIGISHMFCEFSAVFIWPPLFPTNIRQSTSRSYIESVEASSYCDMEKSVVATFFLHLEDRLVKLAIQ